MLERKQQVVESIPSHNFPSAPYKDIQRLFDTSAIDAAADYAHMIEQTINHFENGVEISKYLKNNTNAFLLLPDSHPTSHPSAMASIFVTTKQPREYYFNRSFEPPSDKNNFIPFYTFDLFNTHTTGSLDIVKMGKRNGVIEKRYMTNTELFLHYYYISSGGQSTNSIAPKGTPLQYTFSVDPRHTVQPLFFVLGGDVKTQLTQKGIATKKEIQEQQNYLFFINTAS